ncbi:MAG: 5'-nucleotidase C-terminal domain-containing protein [Myxococcota bacterium]
MKTASLKLWWLSVFLVGCVTNGEPAPASSSVSQRCVTLLSTNDVHGAIEAKKITVGKAVVRAGGLLTMSGYIEAVRNTSPYPVLLVDAGDIYQGTLVSNQSWGRAIIDIYNAIGFDAAVLGNHEFDFGDGEAKNGDELGVVKSRVAGAKFPFVTSNVIDKATGDVIDWPNAHKTLLIERGGIKVGLIGGSTTSTPETTKSQNVVQLAFPDPVPIIIEEAANLRAQGAELIVFVAHIGSGCGSFENPFDTSSCNFESEMFSVLDRLPPGTIDVAAGGHTHQYIAHWYKGVAAIEAGSKARSLARVDACVAEGGGIDRKASKIHKPIAVCAEHWSDGTCGKRKKPSPVRPATYSGIPIYPSQKVVTAATPHLERVAALKNKDLGVELPFALEVGDAPLERNLGLLIAAAMAGTTESGLAIHNRGGVRAPMDAGRVIFDDAFSVSPFGNLVAHVRLTPAEIEQFVAILYSRRSQIPYMHGLSAESSGEGIDVALASGDPWEPGKRYVVATSDFVAFGGDGFKPVLDRAGLENRIITDTLVRDVLIQELQARFPAPEAATAQAR